MKRQFTDAVGTIHTAAVHGDDTWLLSSDEADRQVTATVRRCPDGTLLVERDGVSRPVHVSRVGEAVWLTSAVGTTRWRRYEHRRGAATETADHVASPMTGKVVVVHVAVGDRVCKGDVLVVVEAMKMEQPLTAPRDGVVATVACEPGQLVDGGVELVGLVPETATDADQPIEGGAA